MAKKETIQLSDEQKVFIQHAMKGENILVDACIGSGKTTTIQELCNVLPGNLNILYLTYNRLLKVDAKHKIKNSNVTVTNYHGFAGIMLMRVGVFVAPAEMIQEFLRVKPDVPKYDVVVFDEYQDIDQEISELLDYLAIKNPNMQKIAVGDMDQKIYDKTTLKVKHFIERYLGDHTKLKFTKCFRISKELAEMLGRVWKKDINGVNENCSVEYMTLKEAARFISNQKPKDILCLGMRTGDMAKVLNYLEDKYPDTYNKKSVYASIRNQDANIEPKKTNAIFTTYDSCKGMERRFCLVFDFDEANWRMRIGKPQQSYEILRNIFCVAASRGKEKIIFVQKGGLSGKPEKEDFLSEETLLTNPGVNMLFQDMNISDMFDFKYKEDIEECYNLLDIEKVDMEDQSVIDINDKDCLIDLSPCIGTYQEATFFKKYNIDKSIELFHALHPEIHYNCEHNNLDSKILYLTAQETGQKRYTSQVDVPFVSDEERSAIHKRLSTMFSRDDDSQTKCSIPFHDADGRLLFNALGLIDVLKDNVIYELKFTHELQHTHFLQCACYMLAMELDNGVLWNVKKNEYYKIRIKDRNKFYDQVGMTITKHAIELAHEADDIKKIVSVNSGLMGYAPIHKTTYETKYVSVNDDGDVIEISAPNNNDIWVEDGNKLMCGPIVLEEKGTRTVHNYKKKSNKIAVIDVETNFDDDTVSIGVVIGDAKTYKPLDAKYYVIYEATKVWGMYSNLLYMEHKYPTIENDRQYIMNHIKDFLKKHDIENIFAYSANFDYRHLPELKEYNWFDIMKVAAYKQYNPYLSRRLEYCNTGRLKTGYGVEDIMRMLTASRSYSEKHHALYDALDELKIMELIGLPLEKYGHTKL